jgi:hypothetical protein
VNDELAVVEREALSFRSPAALPVLLWRTPTPCEGARDEDPLADCQLCGLT